MLADGLEGKHGAWPDKALANGDRALGTIPTNHIIMSKRKRGSARQFAPNKKGKFNAPRQTNSRNMRTGGFLGIEKKFFDTEHTGYNVTAAWANVSPTTTMLSCVEQGNGQSQRNGKKYQILSIHIKGVIDVDAVESSNSPLPDQVARVALVLDTQSNGAALTATDVFSDTGTVDAFAFRNLEYTTRFKVLSDQTFVLKVSQANTNEGGVNLFAHGQNKQYFTMNHVFKKPLDVIMDGTTADIARCVNNSLQLVAVGDSLNSNLAYQARLRFLG